MTSPSKPVNPYLALLRRLEALNLRLALREYHRELTTEVEKKKT